MILVDPEGTVAARAPGNVGFTNLYTGDKGEHGQPGTFMGANGKWSLDVQSLNASGLNKTMRSPVALAAASAATNG